MPIPPTRSYVSNLNKQQRKEQLAVAYGAPMPQQLSEEQYEQMRILLSQHDSERKPVTVVDLNNPPRMPYVFQKFPMLLYDLEHSTPAKIITATVISDSQLEDALADGWSRNAPTYAEERVEPLSAQFQREAEDVDAKIAETRRRGRPPNKVA